MASSGVINGTSLLVYVNGTAIAGAKTCKLTTSQEVRDTTTKGDSGWATNAEGLRKWSMSVDGMVALSASTTAFDDLYTLLIVNRTKVSLKFSNEVSGDAWWYGDAYCNSLEMDAPVEESTTFTAAFDGTGVLTQTTHT